MSAAPALVVMPATAADGPAIRAVGAQTGVFGAVDLAVIDELVTAFEQSGLASGYWFVVARRADEVLGFACYGPAPLTEETYDLYWIAATHAAHGQGVGTALLRFVDDALRTRGARLLLIETENGAPYAPARRLYERHGWTITARIRDFYAPGADRLIYAKYYHASEGGEG